MTDSVVDGDVEGASWGVVHVMAGKLESVR